ncbi:unnamed protein product [Cylindrotheca closterium]|uniref:30S ribosomal protein S21 n=1 Tax=Cylindrotheca closterium TaxID=2856 RepID=A0AAD2FS77_9STRA|nr:unnamed protein product [Cylindrotheca closterium]
MAKFSFLLSLFITAVLAFNVQAFAPQQVNAGRLSNTELNVNIKVSVGDGEPIESALRRFKREVNKSGHLMELRHRRTFENSQEKAKRKVKEGRMRIKFERMQRKRMANRT